ncbi:ArnT family glycosyltransferase [Pontibacter actiniarum]|uniref:Glycosyltransferase RgtA/B/C/D-like domain-containing protein n=1 Tax=Pontibacter actiniarum TaxID=323450 RepID=A0A1X9YXB4_9BACT|nr:glycosyltransferase family 39 protein [Pontibacter actiniarum]ARS37555.1 hypothetical protein CA264_20175 [Pontibacter actiniarum]
MALQVKFSISNLAVGRRWFQHTHTQLLLLFLLVGLTYFPQLGKQGPSLMEARNFISAREMVEDGNWLVPTLNGEVRLAKPPLPTWLTAVSGMAAGDIGNLVALRFPAAVMSALMVFFLYFLGRQLTRDKLTPFLAAAVLASSFGLFNIGREGSWDVYCHSFMLGALWLLVKGLRKEGDSYSMFALCGLLMGCSFLSKGPVAFYAMLLPFLVSYLYCFGRSGFWVKRKRLVLTFGVALLLSLAWPVFIFMVEPEALARNVSNESAAWVNRHVKPFWYYWGFWSQTGAWALFTLAAMSVSYARKRINRYVGSYTFIFVWLVVAVLLLSVIPEKKERYLLPAIVPMALLTGGYVRYLLSGVWRSVNDNWAKRLLLFNTGLMLVAAIGFPVAAYLLAYQTGIISLSYQLCLTVSSLILALSLLIALLKQTATLAIVTVLLLNSLVLVSGFPLYEKVRHPVGSYRSLVHVRHEKEVSSYPFYAVDGLPIVHLWEVGKQVDTLRIQNQRLQLPNELPAVVFSPVTLTQAHMADTTVFVNKVNTYHVSRNNPEEVYHIYVLSVKKPLN